MAKIFKCVLSIYMVLQIVDAIHILEKRQLVTCPGFPGYCSEAYPGGVCTVVCAFGRPNVPECQPDGTWTDIPRCIEHEPGKESQVPGRCPGIPGYCSDDLPGGVCEFDCLFGPDIRSFCTPDGTWDPYPFCEGDIRETRDGCDGCPGPFGGPRNRTAEASGGNGGGRRNGNNRKNNGGSNNRRQPNQPARPARPARPANNRRPQGPKQQARPATRPAKPAGNNRRNNGNNRRNNGSNNRRPSSTGNNRRSNARPQNNNRRPQAAKPQVSNRRSANTRNTNSKRPTNKKAAAAAQNSASANGRCPGGDLEMCIDVCPSFSARIFGACVSGCAKRCPSKK